MPHAQQAVAKDIKNLRYALHSIILVADLDVSRHILYIRTSKSVITIMERKEKGELKKRCKDQNSSETLEGVHNIIIISSELVSSSFLSFTISSILMIAVSFFLKLTCSNRGYQPSFLQLRKHVFTSLTKDID
jgi:hypothetical protein